VSYRTPLEARVAKRATKAIVDYGLIEDGDRIMVGLSGGKDSWALFQILDVLRQRAPIDFSLVAVNVNSGYTNFRHDVVTKACAERGWELHVEHTTIGAVMDDVLEDGDTPCSLCARLRRGVLYRLAASVGATKIALGHHLDDFVETLLLNLFFQGKLKAMPARLVSDNKRHIVIRPLVYVTEADARAYTQENGLPVIGCCCPACGDLSLKRQRLKRMIAEFELEHPDVKSSMMAAMADVVPAHLLDRRLNPVPEIARAHGRSRVSRVEVTESEESVGEA
jgi:tRNA 2-thiocytidine biosynthesis protein TtcA